MAQSLGAAGSLAVDAERSSGIRYGNPTEMIQVRDLAGRTFLLDTRMEEFFPQLENRLASVPWILHDGSQDLPGILALGLSPNRYFDTEYAARLVGYKSFGLAYLCEDLLGVSLPKEFQSADWSCRPWPSSWLLYAANDVAYLHDLQSLLMEQLESRDRVEWLEDYCQATLDASRTPKARKGKWRKGISKKVHRPEQLATLKYLWKARESIAQELDVAPHRVVSQRDLLFAASQAPSTWDGLSQLQGFSGPNARDNKSEWVCALSAAQAALSAGEDFLDRGNRRSWGSQRQRELADSLQRKISERVERAAAELGIEKPLLATSAQIKQVARNSVEDRDDPFSGVTLLPWQRAILSDTIS